MSIGELAMLVNDNFDKPLNQQMRELQYAGAYVFTADTKFTPDKNGYYKVIVVGAGGTSMRYSGYYRLGGAGAVAISTLYLTKDNSYSIIANNDDYDYSKFYGLKAYNGGNATNSDLGTGGTASGGDFNYSGTSGIRVDMDDTDSAKGADVGIYIPGWMSSIKTMDTYDGIYFEVISGDGILGYGGGQGVAYIDNSYTRSGPGKGAVIIIPLELTE